MKLSDEAMVIAREICTDRQLQVIELRQRGAGWKLSALALGLDRSTVRGHWEAALRRIEQAERERAA